MPNEPLIDLGDIQGDVLEGLQKNSENFIFFKVQDTAAFKNSMRAHVIPRITTAAVVHEREVSNQLRQLCKAPMMEQWLGVNVSFTKNGLDQLLGASRPRLVVQKNGQSDDHFELGADEPGVMAGLNDPERSQWLPRFTSDRMDGVLLVTGADQNFVQARSQELLDQLGNSVSVVYSEIGNVRPELCERARTFRVFGWRLAAGCPRSHSTSESHDLSGSGAARPRSNLAGGVRVRLSGTEIHKTRRLKERRRPCRYRGRLTPLSWYSGDLSRRYRNSMPSSGIRPKPSECLLSYLRPGWLGDGVAARRWRFTPLQDDTSIGADPNLNNNFSYKDDAFQRACPYAAHIRKTNPRDDFPNGDEAPVQVRRIIRAGIPFGPEVGPTEAVTAQSRGLMFVCYRTSIQSQFEFIQKLLGEQHELHFR